MEAKVYTARQVADRLGHKHTAYVLNSARDGLIVEVNGVRQRVKVGQKFGSMYTFTENDIALFQHRSAPGRPRRNKEGAQAQGGEGAKQTA